MFSSCWFSILGSLLGAATPTLAQYSATFSSPLVVASIDSTKTDAATDTTQMALQMALGPRLGFSPFASNLAATYTADTISKSSPTICVMAALQAEFRATRTATAQRAQFISRPDTLPWAPETVHTAQICGAPWNTDNTALVELPGLFRLALLTGPDDRAHAIGTRWTQLSGPQDTARGEALLRQLQWAVGIRPRNSTRLQLIQQINADIQSLSPSAVEEKISALNQLQALAGQFGEYTQEMTLAKAIRQMILGISSPEQRSLFVVVMLSKIFDESDLRVRFLDDLSSPQLHATVEHTLAQGRRDRELVDIHHRGAIILPVTFQDFMYSQTLFRHDSLFAGIHLRHAQPLEAQYWYGRPDTTVTYPRHSVLTFILPVHVCDHHEETSCEQTYAAWRRLYHEFSPRGVDFILFTKTSGSFGLSTLLPATAEADSLYTYFHVRLRLPGILAIQKTEFTRLSDGRQAAIGSLPQESIVTRDGLRWVIEEMGSISGYENAVAFLKSHLVPSAGTSADIPKVPGS